MKKLSKKKHILEDGKWHHYTFVYVGNGKTVLYVDGKPYKGDCNMTYEMYFRGGLKSKNKAMLLDGLCNMRDELRVSKCARRKV